MKKSDKSVFAQNLKNRVVIIKRFLSRTITARAAAERLQLSVSYIYSLASKAKKNGINSLLILKKRGKPPKKFSDAFKNTVIELYASYEVLCKMWEIQTCSYALFLKTLKDKHNIELSYSALHNILSRANKKSPYAHHIKKEENIHTYHDRADYEGELWLADGSPHHWFGGEAEQCIHILQDDATGKITGLFMTSNECFFGYAEAMKMGLKKFGIPEKQMSDLARVFFNSKKQKDNLSIEDQLMGITEKKTQMGNILERQLGIKMIPAYSPEQKGRVERAGGTLQRILPFVFMLEKIRDIDSANKFLEKYIDVFNAEFAVIPKEKESRYIPVNATDNLDELFSIRQFRKTDSAGVFSFHNYKFQVLADSINIRKRKVEIFLNVQWGIKVKIGSKFYNVELLQLDENKKALGGEWLNLPIVWQELFDKYLFLHAKKESRYHCTG
ncbi:MAG: ISNCY family transposase [Treponemataceae bacterium]